MDELAYFRMAGRRQRGQLGKKLSRLRHYMMSTFFFFVCFAVLHNRIGRAIAFERQMQLGTLPWKSKRVVYWVIIDIVESPSKKNY